MTNLYYESHITIDPVRNSVAVTHLKRLAAVYGFKVAELIMMKGGTEPLEDSFMTGRAKDYEELGARTASMVISLKQNHFKVRRYKIEETIIDSKIHDDLNLL